MIRNAPTLALVAAAVFASHWLSTGPQTQATAAESASLAGVAIVKNQSSPHARLRSVDLTSVRWTEGFWAQQYAQANEVSLRKLWDLAVDVEAGHVIENLRIAGGLAEGKRAGSDWQDAWL
jgi:hypothetical protein